MIRFDPPARRARRLPSLTPMIDVVFLLLVFFMLASRFGIDTVLPLPLASGSSEALWPGPPRLVEIAPDSLRLNGEAIAAGDLIAALQGLMASASDPILLRNAQGATVQDLVSVLDPLRAAGLTGVVVIP